LLLAAAFPLGQSLAIIFSSTLPASERAIAIACFLDFTTGPFLPECNFPAFQILS
jgi:hypothetical protein